MVIMSKASRLSERPKPPTWDEIVEDINGAPANDVVFSTGKDYLPHISGALPSSSPETGLNSSTASAASSDSELDTSQVDRSKVEASNTDVTRLLLLCSEMKDVPAQLLEQYTKLKEMGEDMTKSIKALKDQAQSINTSFVSGHTGADNDSSHASQGVSNSPGSEKAAASSKGKSKQKKKK